MPFIPASPSAPCLHQAAWCLSANSYTCTIAKYVVKMPTYLSPNPTVCIYAKTIAWASSVTDSHSIVSVLLFCAGRCVRYTCWRTRFLCVQLSGRECLTPPASPVWRQVRGGHVSIVPSPPSTLWPWSCSLQQPLETLITILVLISTALCCYWL